MPPKIAYIGVSEGDLTTAAEDLNFQSRFGAGSQSLLGVVQFASVSDGTVIQADWFSPDDRTPPIGRMKVVTASGSKIAGFSIVPPGEWKSSPYMLSILAVTEDDGKRMTASGSIRFFVDMTDEEVVEYLDSLNSAPLE